MILFVSLFVVGCGSNNGNEIVSGANIVGVTDIHLKAGEGSTELLLKDVDVVFADGTTEKPQIITDAQFDVAGRYSLEYKYKSFTVKANLYVYGDLQLYYNKELFTEEKINISFGTALLSASFTRGIEIKDSFGNLCNFYLSDDSAKFERSTGDYSVTYLASDKVGNHLERNVVYSVSHLKNISVENGTKTYADGDIALNIGLDGETDAWLLFNDEMVKSDMYSISADKLTIKEEFFYSLPEGINIFSLITLNDAADFSIEIVDDGEPIFDVSEMVNSTLYAGKNCILDFPNKMIASHEYEYSYSLSGMGNADYNVVDTESGLKLLDGQGKNLGAGFYDLSVTAKNTADTIKTTEHTIKFRVYSSELEVNAPKMQNIPAYSTWQNFEADGERIYKYTSKTRKAWDSRLYFNLTHDEFSYFSYEFKVNSATIYTLTKDAVTGDEIVTDQRQLVNGETGVVLTYGTKELSLSAVFEDKKTGEIVDKSEIKVGTWYKVSILLADIVIDDEKGEDVYLYLNQNNTVDAEILYKNFNFFVEQETEIPTNAVLSDLAPAGGSVYKSKFVYNDELVDVITVPNNAYNGRWLFHADNELYKQLKFDFMVIKAGDISKVTLNAYNGVSAAKLVNKTIYDEAGNIVTTVETGKWYCVVYDLQSVEANTDVFELYPTGLANGSDRTATILIKNSYFIYSEEHEPASDLATVTFISEGKSYGEQQVVALGNTITKPSVDPEKQADINYEYDFDGWYYGKKKWDFDNDIVNSNIVLTAEFIITVTYTEQFLPSDC